MLWRVAFSQSRVAKGGNLSCSSRVPGSLVEDTQHQISSDSDVTAPALGLQLPTPKGRRDMVVPTSTKARAVVDANELVLDDDTDDEGDANGGGSDAAVRLPADQGDGAPENKKARTEGGPVAAFSASKLSLPPPKHS